MSGSKLSLVLRRPTVLTLTFSLNSTTTTTTTKDKFKKKEKNRTHFARLFNWSRKIPERKTVGRSFDRFDFPGGVGGTVRGKKWLFIFFLVSFPEERRDSFLACFRLVLEEKKVASIMAVLESSG